MAVVQNLPCPECQKTGHDRSNNHLMVFDDGNMLCTRSHFHKSGTQYYQAADGTNPIIDSEVTGLIKYTIDQYNELVDNGKLGKSQTRQLALSGMRERDRYEVCTPKEKKAIEREWELDVDHFCTLKVKNLVSRDIKGEIAKFYNVRVGLDDKKVVKRHYYPVYDNTGVIGAKCRTLPKDFKFGSLGKLWGDHLLFGQNTIKEVLDSGRGMDTLIITGGECDAMAAQQMLSASQEGTQWEGRLWHVWSITKGEKCIEEILAQRDVINRFRKILLAFDEDEVGKDLTKDIARVFREKVMQLPFPSGCKDPNAALSAGKGKEFVQGVWNPIEIFKGGSIKTVGSLMDEAKKMPTMGLSWPWSSLDPLTFGIRLGSLYVIGAGTGVGKTQGTKEIVFHLMQEHKERVGVIYLEEKPARTVRSFAGLLINKRLEEPPCTDSADRFYTPETNYTHKDAKDALVELERMGKLLVADTGGNKDIDTVMQIIEEFLAMGVQRIVVDNLTAIEVKRGNESQVNAIDAAMKRMGSFKDEKDVTIFLISHLTRPKEPRLPHENGGEVRSNDFRGAGSINFWSNVTLGMERDTMAETDDAKRVAKLRVVKCRDKGVSVGSTVQITMSPRTGRLLEPINHRTKTEESNGRKEKKEKVTNEEKEF